MQVSVWFWILFNAAILLLLFLDLAVLNRGTRVITFKKALLGSAIWIALAIAFAGIVWSWMGPGKSIEFVTGYLIEEALSVDNLFVFILLFLFFKVPPEQEKTVLFWGILGALVMRGAFILGGVALVARFQWILYAFGGLLIYSGFKVATQGEDKPVDPSRNFVLRLAHKFLPVSENYEGGQFFTMRDGKRLVTPLF